LVDTYGTVKLIYDIVSSMYKERRVGIDIYGGTDTNKGSCSITVVANAIIVVKRVVGECITGNINICG